ncbi:MAG: cellulase family glycosylhydrolase [Bradymonadaceae bacterium]
MRACFDRLWREEDLQESFAQAWAQVARVLVGVDGVFAYDLFNEPFFGSYQARRFEEEVLPPFYERIIDAIRIEDPHTWIAVEPAPSANLAGSSSSLSVASVLW